MEEAVITIPSHLACKGKCGRRGLPREVIDGIHSDYLRLRSCEKVAALWGRSRQSIHDVLARRKVTRARRFKEDVVIWRGIKFTPGKNGYLRRCQRLGHVEHQLHRIVWSDANGPIPDGHQVMFRDGDKRNCDLMNLECLPAAEVSRKTATGENGSTRARKWALVESMARFITREANSMAGKWRVDAADLEQVGRLAAFKAARNFRVFEGGSSFYSYSFRWIKRDIRFAAQKTSLPVDMPHDRCFTDAISSVSLDAPVGEDDNRTHADTIAAEGDDASQGAQKNEAAAALMKQLKRLPKREREILHARFFQQRTLEDIAQDYGVTRERIRQIERIALNTLKRSKNLKRIAA